ncbi:hypothetical protein BpHYR1_021007 [Brachionus plicatilis]|uniref:Uncharacterized protein n=1 Tax=Brachionus plicatilis TaxID=10195 RepID=A0A3M7T0K4_BRAPC|nr:hypothetical protein BpHYR1_021007 [Brachionus plicatilis]
MFFNVQSVIFSYSIAIQKEKLKKKNLNGFTLKENFKYRFNLLFIKSGHFSNTVLFDCYDIGMNISIEINGKVGKVGVSIVKRIIKTKKKATTVESGATMK